MDKNLIQKIKQESFEIKKASSDFGSLLKRIRSELREILPTESDLLIQENIACNEYDFEGNCKMDGYKCDACKDGDYNIHQAVRCKGFKYINADEQIRKYRDIKENDTRLNAKREVLVRLKAEAESADNAAQVLMEELKNEW